MDRYQETFTTWNKSAQLYQDKFMYIDLYNASYDALCGALKENAELLEVGCGPGNISKYLLAKRPDFNLHGIDIAPNMVALAQANNPKANFQCMDARAIDQLKSTYDGIICGFCIPYLSKSDVDKLIADCSLLLHESGLLYISFTAGPHCQSGYMRGSNGNRTYFYFYTLEYIRSRFNTFAFEELMQFNVSFGDTDSNTEEHIILIFKKVSAQNMHDKTPSIRKKKSSTRCLQRVTKQFINRTGF